MSHDFVELARTLKSIMAPGEGFALFMQLDDHYHYASSAPRSNIHATLTEWVARNDARVNVRDPGETPGRALARTQLEAKCAEIGHLLEVEGHRLLLYLFDFGERGHLAWYSNAPDAMKVVEAFLAFTEKT